MGRVSIGIQRQIIERSVHRTEFNPKTWSSLEPKSYSKSGDYDVTEKKRMLSSMMSTSEFIRQGPLRQKQTSRRNCNTISMKIHSIYRIKMKKLIGKY